MKNIRYIFPFILLAAGCSSPEGIELEFNVSGKTAGNVVTVCHTDIIETPLDSLGHGVCRLSGIDAAYLKIFYGQQHKLVYVEDGDNAAISFDGSDFEGTFTFEGRKAPAVEYLNSVKLTALPDEDYRLPFGEYSEKIRKKTDDATALLLARDMKGTGNFVGMEKARIRYSYGNQLLMYPTGHVIMSRDPQYRPDEAYYEVIRGYFTENPEYADIDEYREFIAEGAHILDPDGRDITDLYPKLTAEMKYIVSSFTDSKVRQTLLHHIAAPYIDNFGTEGSQDMINIYRTYVDNPALVADFDAKCDKWNRGRPGKLSADFEAPDISGNMYTLGSFRGKYVYIDIWATWCQPCMREVPHLKELEKKFEGRNIAFVGLSVDTDKAKWETKIRSGEMPGLQLYLGNESAFIDAYEVRSIPRFILIDREGRIINPEMTRPSSDSTAEFLSSLEGI